MNKICLVTASPLIVNFFLVPYLRHLREIGEVHLALDTSGDVLLKETSGAITYSIPIWREIAPWHDLLTLIQLTRYFARNQFDIVLGTLYRVKSSLMFAYVYFAAIGAHAIRLRLRGAPK